MLWVKAFHIMLICSRTLGFLPKSGVAEREASSHSLPPHVVRVWLSLATNSETR